MLNKKIVLREDRPEVCLTTFVNDIDKQCRDTMLIIPGGGYTHVCLDREGEMVALAYLTRGFNSFVLNYSTKENAKFPEPLRDASLALSYIRTHAEEYNVNPDRIFVVGFSAGGHLAASLGLMWDRPEIYENTDIEFGSNRPNGMILGYPVVSGKRYASHAGSFHQLHGKPDPSDEELELYSLENHVKADTAAPMFLFHTASDPAVPVAGSLLLAHEYAKLKLSFELHIFPNGPHGLALANTATSNGNDSHVVDDVATWLDLSVRWVKSLK